jgi:hypothetical protein
MGGGCIGAEEVIYHLALNLGPTPVPESRI